MREYKVYTYDWGDVYRILLIDEELTTQDTFDPEDYVPAQMIDPEIECKGTLEISGDYADLLPDVMEDC